MADPTLLLIHGLGATGGVWSDVISALSWSGRIIVPDLPGHGRAPWTGDYTVGALAAAVGAACEPAEPVIAVGHSLGGGVAICLGSGFFRPDVRGVVGLGIKVSWSDDDVAGMARVAARGVRHHDTLDEARERFLRQSGLAGVVAAPHPALEHAVVEGEEGWRPAQDPGTFAQRPLDMDGLMSGATCPVILGAGENDAMVSADELAAHMPRPRIASGRGHNVQVEDPDWVVDLIHEMSLHVAS